MYDFHFIYSDGNNYEVKGVTKILTFTNSTPHEYTGDEILKAKIPLNLSTQPSFHWAYA